ncbi:MAG: FtsX-like permease family protein [Myxococcota bacterium]
MSALSKKMLRDLGHLKGQVATIAVVLACGIMAMLMLESTYSSLVDSREAYYAEERFADVFARLERAPMSVAARLEALPGVARVYDRIVKAVMLPLPDQPEPVTGRVVSIPNDELPPLNGLHITDGRLPDPDADEEVVLLDQFAKAHQLKVGDRLPVVLNGSLKELEIAGLGMSPEYIFAMAGHEVIADDKRFAVIWMRRASMAPIFQLEGAFNDVVLSLEPGAEPDKVLDAIDSVLEPYGGYHAITRDKQLSHAALTNELAQLRGMALWIPLIFLGVAAFLVNIVISRLILLERGQIAVLKALGYTSLRIALNYLGMVALIVFIGASVGVVLGAWSGQWMTNMYTSFFRFPRALHGMSAEQLVLAISVGLVAGVGSALFSVYRVTQMPPAEAMRPAAPTLYRRSFLSRMGLDRWVGPSVTMIARGIVRRPMRFIFSTTGIAMAVGIYIMGTFSWDSFGYLMNEVFPRQNRGDLQVVFAKPLPERAVRNLAHLPGVILAEGFHSLPVRLHAGARWRDGGIVAVPARAELRQVFHRLEQRVDLPEDGVVMTDKMAEVLGVKVGDHVEAEVMEGSFPRKELAISALVDQPFGLQIFASREWLDRFLGEESRVNSASLLVEPAYQDEVRAKLKDMPMVLSCVSTGAIMDAYQKQTGTTVGVISMILALSAAAIAAGVVYNNARIALSTRSRDLASLRVLGYRRREISEILLGELASQVVLGIPLGCLLGRLWAILIASTIDVEALRFPLRIELSTYAVASMIALFAGVISALIVRRRLDSLDLVEVLKAAE